MSKNSRGPGLGDVVHFIDFGDPRCQKATIVKVHEDAVDDVVDLRTAGATGAVLTAIEYDEGKGVGYWHWPCGQ